MNSTEHTEPEYIIVQPGLGGVAWLGEIIDGEPSPIGRVADILASRELLAQRLYVALVEQRALDTAHYGSAPYAPITHAEVEADLARVARGGAA